MVMASAISTWPLYTNLVLFLPSTQFFQLNKIMFKRKLYITTRNKKLVSFGLDK